MKRQWQGILLYVVIFFVIVAIMAFSGGSSGQTGTADTGYTYNELLDDLDGDSIKSISVQRRGQLRNGDRYIQRRHYRQRSNTVRIDVHGHNA